MKMEMSVLHNGNILIKKDEEYYLIEKFTICGTMISNYAVYKDIYNNLEWFINENNDDRYYCNEYATLEQTLLEIQLGNC